MIRKHAFPFCILIVKVIIIFYLIQNFSCSIEELIKIIPYSAISGFILVQIQFYFF